MKPSEGKQSSQIGELASDVVQYLSKEIETTTNNAMVFRSRIAFAVFFGPFLLLGSVVVAAKGLPISLNRDTSVLAAFAIGCGCFLALALICARIEADAWDQCNRWRALIAELHHTPELEIKQRNLWTQKKMQITYVGAYCLLFVAFLSAIFITSSVRVAQPLDKSVASGRAASNSTDQK